LSGLNQLSLWDRQSKILSIKSKSGSDDFFYTHSIIDGREFAKVRDLHGVNAWLLSPEKEGLKEEFITDQASVSQILKNEEELLQTFKRSASYTHVEELFTKSPQPPLTTAPLDRPLLTAFETSDKRIGFALIKPRPGMSPEIDTIWAGPSLTDAVSWSEAFDPDDIPGISKNLAAMLHCADAPMYVYLPDGIDFPPQLLGLKQAVVLTNSRPLSVSLAKLAAVESKNFTTKDFKVE